MVLRYSPLLSSSSGNAALVGSANACLLVDAGATGKALEMALAQVQCAPQSLQGIVITHEHSDHIKGVGILSRKYDIPIYANERTWDAMSGSIGDVSLKNTRIFETGQDFFIRDINVLPYAVSHDAADPVGYRFMSGGRSIAQMTDTGYVSAAILAYVQDVSLLLLEANHDVDLLKRGDYPAMLKKRVLSNKGHLSNAAAGIACCALSEKGVKRFILGHLSEKNNTEALAYHSVCDALAAHQIQDVQVMVAHRKEPTGTFVLE